MYLILVELISQRGETEILKYRYNIRERGRRKMGWRMEKWQEESLEQPPNSFPRGSDLGHMRPHSLCCSEIQLQPTESIL